MHSILANIDPAALRHDPFPHVVIEDALPADYYLALAESFPSSDVIAGAGPLENNAPYRKIARDSIGNPEIPEIWQDFIAHHSSAAFFHEVLDLWGDDIARYHGGLERNFGRPLKDFTVDTRAAGKSDNPHNRSHDVMMDCQLVINSSVRKQNSVRGPHLDSPHKLFAGLLYFRHPDDRSSGGDFDLLRLKRGKYPRPKPSRIDPRHVERIGQVHYRPNTLVMFINTPYSIHGVTPRSVTEVPRRYINFLGECYRGAAGDFFVAVNPRLPYLMRQATRWVIKHI